VLVTRQLLCTHNPQQLQKAPPTRDHGHDLRKTTVTKFVAMTSVPVGFSYLTMAILTATRLFHRECRPGQRQQWLLLLLLLMSCLKLALSSTVMPGVVLTILSEAHVHVLHLSCASSQQSAAPVVFLV